MALKKKGAATVLAAFVLLCLGPGSSKAGLEKMQKRPDLPSRRPARDVRVERPRLAAAKLATDRIMVRFRPGLAPELEEGLLASYQFRDIRRIPRLGYYGARLPEGLALMDALTMLRLNEDIAYAGPDHRTRLAVAPNDTFFLTYQYNLYNHAVVLDISSDIHPRTKAGADVKAMTAWEETEGDPEVIIAVLDTGVDMTHPELVNKVVSSGRDFVNGDMDATDDNSHGTHVAGVAAAETNNGEGIAGVAWNCRILPVKVMDADGNGYYSDLIDGLIWATDNGARVINLSLGGDYDDPALKDACQYAFNMGVVIAAAAGNDGGPVMYPAAYDDYVLAVSATDYEDEWASFSNFGPEVDVAAPGVYILGPVPQWYAGPDFLPYAFGSGTSASSPHVAGLAALLISDKPWLKPSEVMNIVRYTADDVNVASFAGKDDYIGYGRINMERALVPYTLAPARLGAAISKR
jgi:thermitase